MYASYWPRNGDSGAAIGQLAATESLKTLGDGTCEDSTSHGMGLYQWSYIINTFIDSFVFIWNRTFFSFHVSYSYIYRGIYSFNFKYIYIHITYLNISGSTYFVCVPCGSKWRFIACMHRMNSGMEILVLHLDSWQPQIHRSHLVMVHTMSHQHEVLLTCITVLFF